VPVVLVVFAKPARVLFHVRSATELLARCVLNPVSMMSLYFAVAQSTARRSSGTAVARVIHEKSKEKSFMLGSGECF
jgi:hypothetical protein